MNTGRKPRKSPRALRLVLAENIRAFRAGAGISQEDFADLCGFHRTYIGSVERGERNVTLGTLEAIATAMNVSVPRLLSDEASR